MLHAEHEKNFCFICLPDPVQHTNSTLLIKVSLIHSLKLFRIRYGFIRVKSDSQNLLNLFEMTLSREYTKIELGSKQLNMRSPYHSRAGFRN